MYSCDQSYTFSIITPVLLQVELYNIQKLGVSIYRNFYLAHKWW